MPKFSLFALQDKKLPENSWRAQWDEQQFELTSANGEVRFAWQLAEVIHKVDMECLLMRKTLKFHAKDSVTFVSHANAAFAEALWKSLQTHLFQNEEAYQKVLGDVRSNLFYGPVATIVCWGLLAALIIWIVSLGDNVPPWLPPLRKFGILAVIVLGVVGLAGILDFFKAFRVLRRVQRDRAHVEGR